MKEVGIVLAAVLGGGAVLAADAPRTRAWAMLAALVLTPVLLVAHIWDSDQLRPLRDHPLAAVAIVAVALVGLALTAALLLRRPEVLPVAAMAALPFRVPVASGGSTANLLVPLYLVIAAGVIAHAVALLRGASGRAEPPPRPHVGALEWALMGFVILYAIQATYSEDVGKALEEVVFFYVPFALLYACLRDVDWTPRLLGWCLGALVVLAVGFVGIGYWEYHARELLLNPKVLSANRFASYFRVNSLFFDPNIYGRFLALVMLGITAVLLWSARGRSAVAGGLLLAFLWGGLVLSFSQSSFTALLAGLAVLAALRWSLRWTAIVVAAGVVAGAGVVVAAPGAVHLDLGSSKSADTATSGRYDLIRGGVDLFTARPVAGWGSGAFSRAYRREQHASSERAVSASHTIPITVAAEQGAIGLAAYLVLVALGFAVLLRRARGSPARAAIAAAFAALVVHTMLYAAFLEDPLAWVLLAVGAALARGPGEPARA